MKFVNGRRRMEAVDVEILRFVHEQYLAALAHFKVLCGVQTKKDLKTCRSRILQLARQGYLEERYWKEQGIDYFTLGHRGFKALKRRGGYLHQLLPLYRAPENLNRKIGERLKAGMLRLIPWQAGIRSWTSERVLRDRDKRREPVPTGELKLKFQKVAVHLENAPRRALKGYAELFHDYRRLGYRKVWMILGWDGEDDFKQVLEESRNAKPEIWVTSFESFFKEGGKRCRYEENRGSPIGISRS